MKAFAVLALCVASAAAAPNAYGQPALIRSDAYSAPAVVRSDSYGAAPLAKMIPITSFSHDIRGALSSNLQFQGANGISVSDNTEALSGRGGLYDDGTGRMVESDFLIKKQGSYSYTSPEGLPITINWVADENGFHADGDSIPKPVPLPAEHAEAHRLALARASTSSGYDSYEAPALRSSYDAPAPVVRVQSYDAPAVIRSSSY